jgi:hypothetical protein
MRFLLRRRVEPDPTHISVACGGETFAIALRRRAASRRLTLRVSSATGTIVLTMPPGVSIETARRFAEGQAGWIAARCARVPERIAFAPGAILPLRGIPHRIAHEPGRRAAPAPALDPGGEPILLVRGEADAVPGRIRRFLAASAAADLRVAVERYTAAIGIPARRVTIRDTRSRWGSCSATGSLNFSWRLILAPPIVLDYLAAHEVAHLEELNHSPRFWALLRNICPATDEAERWLKRHGNGLHRYG